MVNITPETISLPSGISVAFCQQADDLAPAEFFVLTSSDLHTMLKPGQDAWPKKCREKHGRLMPGVYSLRRGEVEGHKGA